MRAAAVVMMPVLVLGLAAGSEDGRLEGEYDGETPHSSAPARCSMRVERAGVEASLTYFIGVARADTPPAHVPAREDERCTGDRRQVTHATRFVGRVVS